MKKTIISVFTMLIFMGTISAQTGIKALKQATKEVTKYVTDMKANGASIDKAFELLDVAFQDSEVAANGKAWNKKGAIYNKIANSEMTASLMPGSDGKLAHMDAAVMAYKAFNKAMEVASGKKKKKIIKAALIGLMESENHLNNIGITAFSAKDYNTAFSNFEAGAKLYEILKSNGKKSRIDVDSIRDEHMFYTGVAGFYGDDKTVSEPYFLTNIKSQNPKALSYDALYQLYADKDETKALEYLAQGRKAFPSDQGMLFTEINYFLKAGKLEQLISKLKDAIKLAPDNVSVYLSMGNVYDQLQVKETEAGNTAKAKEYFNLAMDYYNQALTKDGDNVNTLYSMGALYYNKAANMTEEINKFANDFSKAGMAKYDTAKEKMNKTFAESLPYFEKAIKIDPNDLNTLQALREIYARQDRLEESNELKARMEAIQAKGGK